MTGALIILAVTVLTGLILYLTHRPDSASANEGDSPALSGSHDSDGEECCGLHTVCEKGLSPTEGPVYFDDEELDRFAGRQPDSYTESEVEEFREVLYTLLPSDIYPWGASLTRRDIALPSSLRDEWLMLVNG
ncbi:phospholipase [Duncaniella muris]|uniref:phospholipase n=1 Tax=Duncaniella muris TaxID=2094150 RepID=UPI002675795A|nr:phospholipase [Duncaniella muris]